MRPDSPVRLWFARNAYYLAALGIDTEDWIERYAPHIRAIAAMEVDLMPDDDQAVQLRYTVMGTIFTEHLIEAMRRLAHTAILNS